MALPTAAPPAAVTVSHCLLDAQGSVLSAHEEGRTFYAASTIKLHVLLAALRADADGTLGLDAAAGGALGLDADAEGALDLDADVPATRTFTGIDGAPFTLGGDHLDPTHPADGSPVTVRDLLVRMIDRSSNEATNHIAQLIGLPAITATIAALGLTATRMERLIGDGAALSQGLTNETSAADLAATMLATVRDGGPHSPAPHSPAPHSTASPGGLDAAGLALAREALRTQQIPVIATALRKGTDWGSKSGWVDGYRHDVAFIGDPDGPGLRVLAVMTGGLDQDEADERITALVRQLLRDVAA